jgi:hypothetical protein
VALARPAVGCAAGVVAGERGRRRPTALSRQHLEELLLRVKPPEALLRRAFPDFEAGLRELPPFIRDTDFNLHV